MTPDKVDDFVQDIVVRVYVGRADQAIWDLGDRGRPSDVVERLGVRGTA